MAQQPRRRWFSLLLLVAVCSLAWTFVKRPLSVPAERVVSLPQAVKVKGVRLSRVHTADIPSQHGFSVRGASLTDSFSSAITAFVVEHPKGVLLIDAGMGRDMKRHFDISATPLMRAVAEIKVVGGIGDLLQKGGVDRRKLRGVIATHAHFDHISGMDDLRTVPLWMSQDEQAFIRSGHESTILYKDLVSRGDLDVHTFEFGHTPYGPFAFSYDFFGDGSVVVVPLVGHTPGSVGVFVSVASGKRFFFVGDTAWTAEGIEWPAEKPWLARRMVDADGERVAQQLVLIHRLAQAHEGLVVVPAHDGRVHEQIPELPDFLE